MTLIEELAAVAETYCRDRSLSVARVSTLVFNDGSKLGDLLAGTADVTTRRYERALLWFSQNWPAELAWPSDVSRPDPRCDAGSPSGVAAGLVASQAETGLPSSVLTPRAPDGAFAHADDARSGLRPAAEIPEAAE